MPCPDGAAKGAVAYQIGMESRYTLHILPQMANTSDQNDNSWATGKMAKRDCP